MSLDRYAVVGHPIAHSRSPFIHTLFAEQTGQRISYEAFDVEPGRFEIEVAAFRDGGGRGLNVTVPLKEQAHALADALSTRAREAGAVNTLLFETDGSVRGDNTDGIGLVRDLRDNLCWTVADKRVLVLGAGGAAAGVLGPLIACVPSQLVIANRTPARAVALAARFEREAEIVEACGLDALGELPAVDLIVNATSASLDGEALALPGELLNPGACAYDMVYAAEPTPFLRAMDALGVSRMADGRGMLVEQAAESFTLWRGVRPRTKPVIEALGELLSRR